MISRHIFKMGVELEGAWASAPTNWKEDGSVGFREGEICDCFPGPDEEDDEEIGACSCRSGYAVGEVATLPYAQQDELKDHLHDVWPDYWNSSCGMHIHMEMDSLVWLVLSQEPKHALFLSQARRFCRVKVAKGQQQYQQALHRLTGNNTFCSTSFGMTRALQRETTSRYFAFNGAAYHRYGTFELRIWPQLDLASGIELIDFTIKQLEKMVREFSKQDGVVEDLVLPRLPDLTMNICEEPIPTYQDLKREVLSLNGYPL